MRGILILCGSIVVAAIIAGVLWLRRPAHFGAPFGDAQPVALATLSATPEAYADKRVHVRGEIVRQCPVTGHWFFLQQDDGKASPIMIEMDDANLPQRKGSVATVEGRVQRTSDGWRIAASSVEFSKD